MTAEEERRIRERAYSIWEQEGRPHGRDVDHRMRAEAEIAAERSRGGDTAHQHRNSADDRERLSSARQAAEALFTPNRQVIQQSIQEGTAAAGESARKPRVLAISPPVRIRHGEVEAAISPNQQKITPKTREVANGAGPHLGQVRNDGAPGGRGVRSRCRRD